MSCWEPLTTAPRVLAPRPGRPPSPGSSALTEPRAGPCTPPARPLSSGGSEPGEPGPVPPGMAPKFTIARELADAGPDGTLGPPLWPEAPSQRSYRSLARFDARGSSAEPRGDPRSAAPSGARTRPGARPVGRGCGAPRCGTGPGAVPGRDALPLIHGFHRTLAVEGMNARGCPSVPSRDANRAGKFNDGFPQMQTPQSRAVSSTDRLPRQTPGVRQRAARKAKRRAQLRVPSGQPVGEPRPEEPAFPARDGLWARNCRLPTRPYLRRLDPLAPVAQKAAQGMEGRTAAGEAGADNGEREIGREDPNVSMATERIAAFLSPGWLNEPEANDMKLLAQNSLQFIVTGKALGTNPPRTKSHVWGHTREPLLSTQARGQQPAQPSALSCPYRRACLVGDVHKERRTHRFYDSVSVPFIFQCQQKKKS